MRPMAQAAGDQVAGVGENSGFGQKFLLTFDFVVDNVVSLVCQCTD